MRLTPRHRKQRQQHDEHDPGDHAALFAVMEAGREHGWDLVAAGAGFAAAQDLEFGQPE